MSSGVQRARTHDRHAWLDVVLVAVSIAVGWAWVYGRWTWRDLQVPVNASGDAVQVLACIKAFATGDALPSLWKHVAPLGAPFGANWNDVPFEDWLYYPAAVLARIFGLGAGTNLYLLLVQVVAGLAFYGAGRLARMRRDYLVAGAILFALSPFAFARGLSHLAVAVYWHVPLLLFALAWCDAPQRFALSRRAGLTVSCAAAFVAGLLNPYYLSLFLFLLTIVLAGRMVAREWRRARVAMMVLGCGLLGFLVSNGDTISFALVEGRNAAAVTRNLWGLAIYGLRLPDVLFPVSDRIVILDALGRFLQRDYPAQFMGEGRRAYVGLVPAVGLVWLLTQGTVYVAGKRFAEVTDWYWCALGTIALGVVGGINYLLGTFGFVLLRATNRFSIVLMAIALLFLCERLPRTRIGRPLVLLPLCLLVLGLCDQLPTPRTPSDLAQARSAIAADQGMVRELEQQLPAGAMVFALPVKGFPETNPIRAMGDYDHLRPYLWSHTLRFSYGTTKGRGDDDWQARVAQLPVPDMLFALERYGFAALLIDKDAYADGGRGLMAAIEEAGHARLVDTASFAGFRLQSAAQPALPETGPYAIRFGDGFFSAERWDGDIWRWSTAKSEFEVVAPYVPGGAQGPAAHAPIRLEFDVFPYRERRIVLQAGEQKMEILKPTDTDAHVAIVLPAAARRTTVRLASDRPGVAPGSGDTRPLAFRVRNVVVRPLADTGNAR